MRSLLKHETAVFLLAVQFLTRLPLPAEIGYTPQRFAAGGRATFPPSAWSSGG